MIPKLSYRSVYLLLVGSLVVVLGVVVVAVVVVVVVVVVNMRLRPGYSEF